MTGAIDGRCVDQKKDDRLLGIETTSVPVASVIIDIIWEENVPSGLRQLLTYS
jgi:hypothetical protein